MTQVRVRNLAHRRRVARYRPSGRITLNAMNGTGAQKLHPEVWGALADALATYYWYKPDLGRLLKSLFGSDPEVIAGLSVTSVPKRETAEAVVERLRREEG